MRLTEVFTLSLVFELTGQGAEECFISQPRALLYSFVLPVALLMIFNLFALGHIVIRKNKKGEENHDTISLITFSRVGRNA